MTPAGWLVKTVRNHGSRIWVEGDDLLIEPIDWMNAEDLEVIREHKPAILDVLEPHTGCIFHCDRCHSDKFTDTTIHNGQSARRDCAHCKRTAVFPVWLGTPVRKTSVSTKPSEVLTEKRVK